MSKDCCQPYIRQKPPHVSDPYRRVLWIALCINTAMFAVEVLSSIRSDSVALLADSLDFLGDAANYGISLAIIGMALTTRARASVLKGISMAIFGLWVLAQAALHALEGGTPAASTMLTISVIAVLANGSVAAILFAYREGDSNMRGVWLCTRNDVVGNLAVVLAAFGVFGTGQIWPDLLVATIMALLALTSAVQVIRHAQRELATVHSLGADTIPSRYS